MEQRPVFLLCRVCLAPSSPARGCGKEAVELTEPAGEFGTVGAQYDNHMFCSWRVTVETEMRVHLHFKTFGVEPGPGDCSYDSVKVYDGDRLIATFCGGDIPGDLTASGNTLRVTFTSDISVTDVGFTVAYSAKKIVAQVVVAGTCGRQAIGPAFPRIVGGSPAKAHSWPWQFSLKDGSQQICGGTIIRKNWLLTAAHCVHGGSASRYSAVVGEHNRRVTESREQTHAIDAIFVHEAYDSVSVNNDIALLKLKVPITYSEHVSPACLPDKEIEADTICVATGWGTTQSTGDNIVLLQVKLPIIERQRCGSWYGNGFTSEMICAGYELGGKDTCQGDSGGPLVCRPEGDAWKLYGITSWGEGCAQQRRPGIYTRVTRFIDWIEKTMNDNGGSP